MNNSAVIANNILRSFIASGILVGALMIAGAGDLMAAPPAPNKPISGKLHGKDFRLDSATIDDGCLELRQGTNFWADASVKIFLHPKEGESLEGKVYKEGAVNNTGNSAVQVHMDWVEKEGDMPKTEMFMSDELSLNLEFGKRVNYKMPGKISLTLKDKMNSHLEGTFVVGPSDDESAYGAAISGKIIFKGGTNGLAGALGCAGKTIGVHVNTYEVGPDGKVEGPGSSTSIDGSRCGMTCVSWKPRNSAMLFDKNDILTHRHVNRPPGSCLVMLRGSAREPRKGDDMSFREIEDDGCIDWKWLVIKDAKERINLDLNVDTAVLGKLDVSVADAPERAAVSYMPLDAAGNLPLPGALTYYGAPRRKLENGKVVINWLKEGKYRLLPVPGDFSESTNQTGFADVEVKRGITTKVNLVWPGKTPEKPKMDVPVAVKSEPKPGTYVDETRGWTGLESNNNVYTFKVDSVKTKATFKAWASGDIGTDSSGHILMTGPGSKDQVIYIWKPSDFKVTANSVNSYAELTPITCDISSYVKQPGDYQFAFKWSGGQVGLAILRVELELK